MGSTFCNCHEGSTNSYSRMDQPTMLGKEAKCDDYPVRSLDSEDVPIWGEATLPEKGYLLMAAIQQDRQCGEYIPYLYHLPIASLTPGSTIQGNTYVANANGGVIAIPPKQVRAGYTYNNRPNDMRLATLNDEEFLKAQYIVLAQNDAQSYIIQGTGFYTFSAGHDYIPGYTYYLGENGEPTTDSSYVDGVRQKLFEVIDQRTILINIQTEKE